MPNKDQTVERQIRDAVESIAGVAAAFAGGTKTLNAAATPEALVASVTPAFRVWVGAPLDADGNPTNTKPAFLGDADGQNIPVMPANFEGVLLGIDDAAKVYVKVGVNGEGVAYRVFK